MQRALVLEEAFDGFCWTSFARNSSTPGGVSTTKNVGRPVEPQLACICICILNPTSTSNGHTQLRFPRAPCCCLAVDQLGSDKPSSTEYSWLAAELRIKAETTQETRPQATARHTSSFRIPNSLEEAPQQPPLRRTVHLLYK